MKSILDNTLEDFKQIVAGKTEIPRAKYNDAQRHSFSSIVIVPTDELHESSFQMMAFVACDDNKPVLYWDNGTDILCLDGIGGYGDWSPPDLPCKIDPKGWRIDMLPCGLVRLFARGKLESGDCLSSFEIYAE